MTELKKEDRFHLMQNTDTERILLTNLSHGDAKAFESLFMLYFPKLKLFLSGFLLLKQKQKTWHRMSLLNCGKTDCRLQKLKI